MIMKKHPLPKDGSIGTGDAKRIRVPLWGVVGGGDGDLEIEGIDARWPDRGGEDAWERLLRKWYGLLCPG